jgi:hypothetical protein
MRPIPLLIVCLMLAAALAGCTATRLDGSHPLLSNAPDNEVARVYFIRPRTERFMGVADNTLTIEADRTHLLDLAKGEYALVYLKPAASVWLLVRSDTSWGPVQDIKEMTREKEFAFAAGQTYFVALIPVDGEFRGVYFNPVDVTLDQAKQMAATARPSGTAARRTPIDSL